MKGSCPVSSPCSKQTKASREQQVATHGPYVSPRGTEELEPQLSSKTGDGNNLTRQ